MLSVPFVPPLHGPLLKNNTYSPSDYVSSTHAPILHRDVDRVEPSSAVIGPSISEDRAGSERYGLQRAVCVFFEGRPWTLCSNRVNIHFTTSCLAPRLG